MDVYVYAYVSIYLFIHLFMSILCQLSENQMPPHCTSGVMILQVEEFSWGEASCLLAISKGTCNRLKQRPWSTSTSPLSQKLDP